MKNLNKNRIFRFNRRIRGRTDYKKRLNFLKSNLPRVVIRSSNKSILVQLIEYELKGDNIITSAKSRDLVKLGFTGNTSNISASYLTGYLVGKKAQKKKFNNECIVDLGLAKIIYGSKLFAAVKGLVDSGVKVRVSEEVFPSEDRINGSHLKIENAKTMIQGVKKKIEEIK